ncbi:MAG: type II toxin-antitoxin system RelE/ParE family toxin [Candidatus Staskawiczbacteria bacterium]|nr:type II toxin-antitoxin system RelE/ParE family toxin [Candidatus Staskawiczbacteria bacterium]
MEISFKDRKLKKLHEDGLALKRKYGDLQAQRIVQRINELLSAESLFDISKLPQARLHLLKGDFKKCFALDIKHPYRIIITYLNGDPSDLKSITQVKIIEIIDYH